MKKKNGFIAISVIYSFFILFLLLMVIIITRYSFSRRTSNSVKNDIDAAFGVTPPEVTITPNSNANEEASYNIKVHVNRGTFPTGTIKYAWSKRKDTAPVIKIDNDDVINLSGTTGKYYLIVQACDTIGNCTTSISGQFNVNNNQIFEIDPNGSANSTSYFKTASPSVRFDESLIEGNLVFKYKWSTSPEDIPTETTFTNNSTITSPEGISGDYYLNLSACNPESGVCINGSSKEYHFDNTKPSAPVITAYKGTSSTKVADNVLSETGLQYTIAKGTTGPSGYKIYYCIGNNCNPNINYNGRITDLMSNSGQYVLRAKVVSNTGIESDIASYNAKVDINGPSISVQLSASGWTKSNTATVTFSDDASGIDTSSIKAYCNSNEVTVNKSGAETGKITDVWSSNRDDTCYYKVCDTLGNCTNSETFKIQVDSLDPTFTSTSISNQNWTSSSVTATVKYTDSGSGINTNSLKAVCGSSNVVVNSSDKSTTGFTDTWTSERNSTCHYEICDNVGNCSSSSNFNIKIDKTKPSFTSVNISTQNWTKENVIGTVKYSDAASGINASSAQSICGSSTYTVTASDKSTTGFTDTWASARNSTCYYKICDNAGNCANSENFNIKIDRTAPTISGVTNSILKPDGSVAELKYGYYAKINASDSASGIASYSASTGSVSGDTILVPSLTAYTVTVKDNAGNTATASIAKLDGVDFYIRYLYKVLFNRDADSSGLQNHVNQAKSGTKLSTIVNNLASSQEYTNRGRSNEDYVGDIYKALLGRKGSSSDITYHAGLIKAGTLTRSTLINTWAGSDEYKSFYSKYGFSG